MSNFAASSQRLAFFRLSKYNFKLGFASGFESTSLRVRRIAKIFDNNRLNSAFFTFEHFFGGRALIRRA